MRSNTDASIPVIVLAIAAPLALTPAALAQSASTIQAYLRKANAECQIDTYSEVYRGPLPGAVGLVTVATFNFDECGGGNNGAEAFGVFSSQGGAVQEWKQAPSPAGRVSKVSVQDGRIVVGWRNWKQSDPQCCPSIVHRTVYALRNGEAVSTR